MAIQPQQQIMSFVSTLKDALTETREKPGAKADGPAGTFWCTECDERLPPADAVVAPDSDDDQSCPSCGSLMTFERSPDSGDCAC